MFQIQKINLNTLSSELPCDFSDLQGLINRSQSLVFNFRNWTFDLDPYKTEISISRPVQGTTCVYYLADSNGARSFFNRRER